jgi:hypothetical protein
VSDSSSSDRPHLEAVREDAEDAELVEAEASVDENAPAEAADQRGGRASGTIIGLLCLTLAVCVFVMLTQARQTEKLQGQIVALGDEVVAVETALAAAEAEVARQQALIGQVRSGVAELLQSAGALARLVEGPAAPAAEESAPPAQPVSVEPVAAE